MSIVESAKVLKEKCVKLLASFSLTYELNTNTMGLSMSPEESLSTGLLIDDLSEIFVALGKLAKESRAAVCVFIDELQFLQTDQIRAMVTALHRCNQLRLPISIFCAGLPKSVEVLNRSCSYSERLFESVFIDKLAPDEAAAAITEPAESLGVHYQSDAVDEIVITTSGYPYFIQEYCSVIWNRLPEGTRNITHEAVISSRKAFYEKLDTGFFEARYSRCSPSERTFMLAMTRCAELPCQINEIASNMKKNVSQISPIRVTLIEKGIVYAPVRGELDFTVPLFGQYLRRNTTDD